MRSDRAPGVSKDLLVNLQSSAEIVRREAAQLTKDANRLHRRTKRIHVMADYLHRKIHGTRSRIRTYRSLNRIRRKSLGA